MNNPLISIVVPSFNQAAYLPETLQSLVDQEYSPLEVIIQDGGSTDGSVAIAEDYVQRYPGIFQLHVEQDEGQADALNRGFARARGEILAFLNSDDTYYPRVLHRVAAEIDPAQDRFVIVGRCMFTGEGSRYVGIEHPAEYASHFEHLAIWKRGYNTIPQPSVFWHRKVWERCGGLDVNEHHALDYDLFCRFSEHFTFHRVDQLFSTYRMHDSSKSAQKSEAEVLDLSIGVSRKHWGPWTSPLRWRCELSYRLHRLQLHERARHHARRAEAAFAARQWPAALREFFMTGLCSPRMARDRLLYGWLAARGVRAFERWAIVADRFTGRYEDGWIGPHYREVLAVPPAARQLQVGLSHFPQPGHRRLKVGLRVNGNLVGSRKVTAAGSFTMSADMAAWQGAEVAVEIVSSSYFSPGEASGSDDRRALSLKLDSISID